MVLPGRRGGVGLSRGPWATSGGGVTAQVCSAVRAAGGGPVTGLKPLVSRALHLQEALPGRSPRRGSFFLLGDTGTSLMLQGEEF